MGLVDDVQRDGFTRSRSRLKGRRLRLRRVSARFDVEDPNTLHADSIVERNDILTGIAPSMSPYVCSNVVWAMTWPALVPMS